MSENQPIVPNQPEPENATPLENGAPVSAEPQLPVPAPLTPVAPIAPPPATAPTLARTRPLGITIIALLAIIQGFGGFCAGISLLFLGGILVAIPSGFTQVLAVLACFGGLLIITGPLLHLIFAYGAWNLRKWAWWLGIAATTLSILGVVISLVGSGGALIWAVITNALLPIVILAYLLMPKVRQAFEA